jgi:hypothetical protein
MLTSRCNGSGRQQMCSHPRRYAMRDDTLTSRTSSWGSPSGGTPASGCSSGSGGWSGTRRWARSVSVLLAVVVFASCSARPEHCKPVTLGGTVVLYHQCNQESARALDRTGTSMPASASSVEARCSASTPDRARACASATRRGVGPTDACATSVGRRSCSVKLRRDTRRVDAPARKRAASYEGAEP